MTYQEFISILNLMTVSIFFSVKIIGGHSIDYGEETAAVRFFSPNHLPFFMIPHRKMQIKKSTDRLNNSNSSGNS